MTPLRGGSHFTSGQPITFIFSGEFIFNGTDQTINQYETLNHPTFDLFN